MTNSQRYFIKLDYNGANYHGWQIQPNGKTVQGEVNKALSLLLKEEINVVGCGRTDTGVHARNFFAHFNSEKLSPEALPQLLYKMNRFLHQDIAIRAIFPVHEEAHARFDATHRTYKYYITTAKDPYQIPYRWLLSYQLNLESMNAAAEKLLDYTDFTSFSKVDTDTKTNDCKITYARWEKVGDTLIFTITADRFLRNMVRAIVGTLVNVGQEKISLSEFCSIIERKDRGLAGASAPGNALFLEEVGYPYLESVHKVR